MNKNFFELSEQEIKMLIDKTAEEMNINKAIVEKDLWVCIVIDYLFNKSIYKDVLTFKGGTSLSKCFNIIERFSEDIDLILDWTCLGIDKDEPMLERSNTQQDKYNDEINNKAAIFIKDNLLEDIKIGLSKFTNKEIKVEIDDKEDLVINFYYPRMYEDNSILQYVRLEIGPLAALTPSSEVYIEPYINQVIPDEYKIEPIKVLTVNPERTFWEKATILHREANRPLEKNLPKRYARHYYDLFMFMKTSYYKMALKNKKLLEKVIEFKKKFYRDNWANYDECLKRNFKLMPNIERFDELENDYNSMKEMIYGKTPSFEEILNELAKMEEEINTILNKEEIQM